MILIEHVYGFGVLFLNVHLDHQGTVYLLHQGLPATVNYTSRDQGRKRQSWKILSS